MNDEPHNHQLSHMGKSDDQEPGYYARRIHALEMLLVEKGVFTRAEIAALEQAQNGSIADGARVVARAWMDPNFKNKLLTDAKAAIWDVGIRDIEDIPDLVVVENKNALHHLVVCTLCSCYPTMLLGRPPDWYKSLVYRSRAVVDPRGIMEEFGLTLGPEVEVRVLDSTADVRYLVLPIRPEGTEEFSENELAKLVTRDSMIGVSNPLTK